jgi:hypothetical protein
MAVAGRAAGRGPGLVGGVRDTGSWGTVLTALGILSFSFYIVLGRRLVARMGSFRAVTFAFVFAVRSWCRSW